MNDKRRPTNKKSKRYSKKIAATAGAVTGALLAPGAADAAIIHVTGAPVSLSTASPNGTTVSWDVDGVGGAEFELFINKFTFNTSTSGSLLSPRLTVTSGSIHLASATNSGALLNGYGLVAPFPTDNVQALFASFNVGPTLASGFVWGAGPGYRFRNAMEFYAGSATIGYDFNYGFTEGDNYFGFRFGPSIGNLQYGWGIINFDTTNGVVTISEWAYETALNTPIHISSSSAAVPEPSSLALLATGAAGLLFWRRRRKDEDEA